MLSSIVAGAASKITAPIKSIATEYCVKKVMQTALGDDATDKYFPVFFMFYNFSQGPVITGDETTDESNWISHVDRNVSELESRLGYPINGLFSDTFIQNFEIQTGQNGDFMRSREDLIEYLYRVRSFSGLAEGFLKHPIEAMEHHSITLQDRFHSLLPEYLHDIGLRFVGSVESQPAMSLRQFKIRGIAYYNKKELTLDPNDNPFEKVVGGREVYDENDNLIATYKYYGPNNRMDDEYIRNNPPINHLDSIGYRHDLAYAKYGYNTPGAKEADRILVKEIKEAIKNGTIKEDSAFEEYKRAKSGLKYFEFLDIK